jgi:hypothetical protein
LERLIRNPSELEVAVFVSKAGVRPRAIVAKATEVAVPVSKVALLVKAVTVEDSPCARPEIEINPDGLTTAVALSFELLALQL